jgi:uncharacterized repeat protein (TIGR01451 family)
MLRGYKMKKVLNISFILLVLCLSGSLSCKSLLGSKGMKKAEPNQVGAIDWSQVGENWPGSQTESAALPGQQEPGAYSPGMIAVREVGSSVVSRTFPWPECGIVHLDKVMPKEVGLNKPFNYTIKITNLTDTTLNGIIVNEEIPNNLKFINANPPATEDQNKLTWEIESLGPKAVRTITISGTADYAAPLKPCTTVLTPVVPACATVDVIEPRLSLIKTAPAQVLLCDMIPVKYVVTNSGTGTVPNVKIMDSLPPGLRTTDGRGDLVFDAGNLGAGQSREFSIELRPTRTGTYVSKAVANSTTGLRAESDETTTVVSLPILSIQKTGPEKLYVGRPATYEIIVTNVSDVAARETVVEDTIPEGVTSVKATSGAKLMESNSKLVWNLGILEPKASETLHISYTPTKPGAISNGATASAYCAEPVSATMKTLITGIPAIMLEVVDLEDPVRVGDRVTYMITVTNQGSATSTNIRVSCILENNVRYVSSAGATTSSVMGDTVRFLPLAGLAPHDKAVWRVVVEAVKPGDVRFKVSMVSDELTRPVEESEATRIYE